MSTTQAKRIFLLEAESQDEALAQRVYRLAEKRAAEDNVDLSNEVIAHHANLIIKSITERIEDIMLNLKQRNGNSL